MSNEIEIRITGRNMSDSAMMSAEANARKSGDRITAAFAQAGEKSGHAFTRGLDGRLRDSRGRFVKAGQDAGDGFAKAAGESLGEGSSMFARFFSRISEGAASLAANVGTSLTSMFPALGSFASTTAATGGVNLLVIAMLALVAAAAAAAAGMVALAPVVFLIGGTFGGAQTAVAGLVATVAVLAMGLSGLGDAWTAAGKKTHGGGRSAADAVFQIRTATQALADAQLAAVQAQEAVTRARANEVERLEDLSRSLAGARLDEKSAALAVLEAEQRLKDARRSGTGLDVLRAINGVEQAKQNLEDVKDRVGDLAIEQDEANRKGVEGSDQVKAALERQLQAQRQIEQATHALAQAQHGAGGGVNAFATAMAKLSPNAQSLITTLIALKPRFDDLKRSVQDRLLSGFDVQVRDLATRWLPALGPMLGSLADRFNGFGKKVFGAVSTPQFIGDVNSAVATFGRFIGRLGDAMPSVISAFGRLARAAKPFFDMLGDKVTGMLTNFGNWIEKLDKSGKLDEFFNGAADSLNQLWTIGGLTLDVIVEIIKILFPGSKKESETFMGGVIFYLEKVKAWLADPKNQKRIQDWIDKIQSFREKIIQTADKLMHLIEKFDAWATKIELIIARINAFSTGFSIGFPNLGNIPGHASGGIAGGLSMVAERGRELIDTPSGMLLAIPPGSTVHPNGATEAMLASGGGGGILRVVIDLLGADDELRRRIRKATKVYGGGNVQVAFGRGSG